MKRQQTGVALITAVMIVAFATTVAAAMLVRQNIAVHRSGNLTLSAQAWWYLIGLEQWAGSLLTREFKEQAQNIDSLDEAWAQPVDFLPVDEGSLAGRLTDLQGRFNLNRLSVSNPTDLACEKEQLARLIRSIDELRSIPAEQIASGIADWIDANFEPSAPYGAEDSAYLSREPPYRTANAEMASPSELLLIDGIDATVWRLLEPHVTVLPAAAKSINVNTASAPVLSSLRELMDPAELDALISKRETEPFTDVADFLDEPAMAGAGQGPCDAQNNNQRQGARQNNDGQPGESNRGFPISVNTSWFRADAAATVGSIRVGMASIIYRDQRDGSTRVIAHARGSL